MPKTIKLAAHLQPEELENRYRKAFVPAFGVVNKVPNGAGKIELKPLNSDTKTDQNDFFRVTVEEQPRG